MRGVGATCIAPKTHGRPKRMTSPGILQDRRWMNSASSPFRLNGVSSLAATIARGFASRSTVFAGRAMYASFVFRGQGARQAPIFLQESEDGIRRRLRRQTARIFRHMAAGRAACIHVSVAHCAATCRVARERDRVAHSTALGRSIV